MRKHTGLGRLILVLCMLSALAGVLVVGDVSGQVGAGATLTVLRGTVAVSRADGSSDGRAASGLTLGSGDSVGTVGAQSGALVTFFDGSEVELGGETTIILRDIARGAGGRVNISFENVVGSTVNRVIRMTDPGSSYRVEAGSTVALVRGTVFGHRRSEDGRVTVALVQADNPVYFPTDSQLLRVGEVCTVTDRLETFCDAIGARNVWDALADGDGIEAEGGTINPGLSTAKRRIAEQPRGDHENDPPPPPSTFTPTATSTQVPTSTLPGSSPTPPPPGTVLPIPTFTQTPTPTSTPGGPVSISINDVSVAEGDAGPRVLTFTVSLSGPSFLPVSVQYQTADGTASSVTDYAALPATVLNFPPLTTSQVVNVTVNGDLTVETDETFTLALSAPVNATLARTAGVGTIVNDDSIVAAGAQVTVNSAADDNVRDAVLTLREAILAITGVQPYSVLTPQEQAQFSALPPGFGPIAGGVTPTGGAAFRDLIIFSPSVTTVTLTSGLPGLSSGNDVVDGRGAVLIQGAAGQTCLTVSSNGNSVQGLRLRGCQVGIAIAGGSNNVLGGTAGAATRNVLGANTTAAITISGNANAVRGSFIGTDAAGTGADPNGDGVRILAGSTGNVIGGIAGLTAGACTGDCSLISGNSGWGVRIFGAGAAGNLIQGSFIGVNLAGAAALPNGTGGPSLGGVEIQASAGAGNQIGAGTGDGNVISGNTGVGVRVSAASSVRGNIIGLNAGGTAAVPNSEQGIEVDASGVIVGGVLAAQRNVVSGNGADGVRVSGPAGTGASILGNYIGTNASGSAAIGNTGAGVYLAGGAGNTVGGSGPGSGNLIAGNTVHGIHVQASNNNQVQGNLIGTDATGVSGVANGTSGIQLELGAANNQIGGTAGTTPGGACTGACNLISGNTSVGISVGQSTSNTIVGNMIGAQIGGAAARPNGIGIDVANATGLTVGGINANERNLISGNTGAGLRIRGATTSGVVAQGNFIGTSSDGTTALANAVGVSLETGASAMTIGGTAGTTPGGACTGACNVISGNTGNGVQIVGATTNANTVSGNHIGVNGAGTGAVANGANGVAITTGAQTNVIGGSGAGNVISGNALQGVTLQGAGTHSNRVEGNRIGTNSAGAAAIPNAQDGVGLAADAGDVGLPNVIGGGTAALGNVISGNLRHGVRIIDVGTDNNTIQSNRIGTNAAGTAALANTRSGVSVEGPIQTVMADNVISGNGESGVIVTTGGVSTTLARNTIGLNQLRSAAVPNALDGVTVLAPASQVIVGNNPPGFPPNTNYIAGNGRHGVSISGNNVLVFSNVIGLNGSASAAIPNNDIGVLVQSGANGVRIGGTAAGDGNVISGNNLGVGFDGRGIGIRVTSGATNTLIEGNRIGTNPAGTAAIHNRIGIDNEGSAGAGTIIGGTTGTTPGGSCTGACNLVSGNTLAGIFLTRAGTVLGNFVGVNLPGTGAIGNGGNGIIAFDAGAVIGSLSPNGRNVVSGNAGNGMTIASSNATILGNYIGVSSAGTAALGNTGVGVSVSGGGGTLTGVIIGGTTVGATNVVSGNGGHGVEINGSPDAVTNTTIQGNLIGTNAAGSAALGNGQSGVRLVGGTTANLIGGAAVGARNVISGNGQDGISAAAAGTGNVIQGNIIGENALADTPVPNGNNGVNLEDTADTNVGEGGGNRIHSNGDNGVRVSGGPASGNRILDNDMGDNGLLGIALVAGGNGGIATPTITGSSGAAGTVDVETDACNVAASCRAQVFVTDGAGEGLTLLGSAAIGGLAGLATYTAAIPAFTSGLPITITVTRLSTGNTSQFAPEVIGGP